MVIEGIKKYFARHVHRRINIYTPDAFIVDLPKTRSFVRQHVKTFKIEPDVHVKVSRIDTNLKKSERLVKIYHEKLKLYTKRDVKIKSPKLRRKINIYSALKQIQAMPQERKNMLKFQKERPPLANSEALLACYYPIVDGAVLKLALNKQRGTLLVWYNPTSRQLKSRSVYLVRRLGLDAKAEWRWV